MKIDFLGLLDDGIDTLTVILVGPRWQSMYAEGPKIRGSGRRPRWGLWSALVGYLVGPGRGLWSDLVGSGRPWLGLWSALVGALVGSGRRSGRLWSALWSALVGPGRPWSALVGTPTYSSQIWSGRPWSALVGPGRPWSALVGVGAC